MADETVDLAGARSGANGRAHIRRFGRRLVKAVLMVDAPHGVEQAGGAALLLAAAQTRGRG